MLKLRETYSSSTKAASRLLMTGGYIGIGYCRMADEAVVHVQGALTCPHQQFHSKSSLRPLVYVPVVEGEQSDVAV